MPMNPTHRKLKSGPRRTRDCFRLRFARVLARLTASLFRSKNHG
ncbi:hypothetical protein WN55_07548 [Dufourea novaeangliae]|uniref:Uncharacterized protein n=1 Tax=Dufourea novaeangliae TaxID=178035 RepID=A0A154P4A6_DUFNO|nr:hypothetical protein WN55_07548 [Dufourea novaeangliae]